MFRLGNSRIADCKNYFAAIVLSVAALLFLYTAAPSGFAQVYGRRRNYINVKCSCIDNETDRIHEFCFTTVANGTNVTGVKFSCEWLPYLKRLNLLNPAYSDKPAITGQVFVTGATSDHFAEANDHLGSLIAHFSNQNNTRFIFYDFGLTPDQAKVYGNICHVEYRVFNFSNYPDSVRRMKNYRFKFLLFAELMQEFDAVWWADSSIRWHPGNLSHIYDAVNNQSVSPFLLIDGQQHSVLTTTHKGMFRYLPADMDKLHMKEMFAGGFLFVARSNISAKIMKWAVLCSLEPECMEPKGAALPCWWVGGHDRWKLWAGCHRYDQSMINVLMSTWWNYNVSLYTANRFKKFASIMRKSVGQYNLGALCKQS